jgi:ssDNA-binding replication factor A large subunit
MKISDLKPGMAGVSLRAKIEHLTEPRQIMTRFGTQTTLTEATLSDETGSIQLALWGEQSEGIEEGAEVEISRAFVKEFKGEPQLTLGRGGSIKIIA